MTITDELHGRVIRTARALDQGAGRRRYMADTLKSLALGQREAQMLFEWGRDTIQRSSKGQAMGSGVF